MKAELIETNKGKIFRSENYNFIFDKETGFFARWGKKKEDDPTWSPFGPELADIEISTKCSGVDGIGVCKFCYKSNTPKGEHMTFDTFKKLFKNLPKTVTQIAFGIGDVDGEHANPDMWSMFEYCRQNGVIPNVTVNGEHVSNEVADKLVAICGAVAVSVYDKEKSYNTIQKLTERGMSQVNIHYMICKERLEGAYQLMQDRLTDPRLSKMNAIVFLSLKPKGRAKHGNFTSLTIEEFRGLVTKALDSKIAIGFDSCGASKFLEAVKDTPRYDEFYQMVEPCESTKFSLYISTEGKFFPCSFVEGETVENGGDWKDGLDVVNCNNFIKDIWMNEKTKLFREKCIGCISNGGSCPHYSI